MAKQLKSKGNSATIKRIPQHLATALSGYSVNEALNEGIIDDVCDSNGAFIKRNNTSNTCYAIIGLKGVLYGIGLSEGLEKDLEDFEDLGDLTFYSGMSQDKYKDGEEDENGEFVFWAKLGKPQGLNLGETVKAVELEPEVK